MITEQRKIVLLESQLAKYYGPSIVFTGVDSICLDCGLWYCLLCGFEAVTEEEVRQHVEEKHPGAIERSDELVISFHWGDITAREVRETLQREFA